MPEVTTDPRKKPRQSRSKTTVQAILEAATHILVKEGYRRFNTNHVADKAGVSIGSLYQYFPNKDALIAALSLNHIALTRDAISNIAFSPDIPLHDIIRQIVKNHIALHKIDPELHQVLTEEVAKFGGLDHQKEMFAEMQQTILSMMAYHPETKKIKHPRLVMYMSFNCVEAITHDATMNYPEIFHTPLFEEELVRLILGYIRGAEMSSA